MRTSEQINELVAALAKARPKFGPVIKDVPVSAGARQYSYAPLKNGIEATCEPLAAQGLVVFQAFDAETSTLITRLAHTSGQWVEAAYPLHAFERPQDYGSQGTYARRYSLFALLNLAVEDDDGQAAQDAPRAENAAAPRPSHGATPPKPQNGPQAPPAAALVEGPQAVFVTGAVEKVAKTGKPYWTVSFTDRTMNKFTANCFDAKVGPVAVQAAQDGLPMLATIENDGKGAKLIALRENDEPF